jgi:hypothetical protein
MTLRAALTGLVCVAALCIATPFANYVMQGSGIAANHLPTGAIFIFIVLVTFLNPALRWLGQKRAARRLGGAFTRSELIVVLIMMLVACSVPGYGFAGIMLPLLAAATYFATPENRWDSLFHQYFKDWVIVRDPQAIRWFYHGLPPGQAIPWMAWLKPMMAWGAFALLFWASFFFLGVIVRRQWIEHERLDFPLAQVPLDLLGDEPRPAGLTPLLRNKLMWAGFLIVFFLHASNSLHTYFGFFPGVPLNVDIGRNFVQLPWSAWKDMRLCIYPSLVGIAYLISAEVAFSLWFFYWFNRLQALIITASGFEVGGAAGGFNSTVFFRAQEAGAFIAVAVYVFWSARRQLARTLKDSLRGQKDPEDPIPAHLALVGLFACVVLMGIWSAAAGMNMWASLLLILIFYVVAIGLTRLVSAGGAMYVECAFLPQDVANNFLGSRALGWNNLAVGGLQQRIFMHDQEVTWWPYLMNSLKLAHHTEIPGKHVIWAVALAMPFAVIVSYMTCLTLTYHHGGLALDRDMMQGQPVWVYNKLKSFIEAPVKPDKTAIGSTMCGGLFMLIMLHMNRNYLWWRLNPLGYIMGSTGTLAQIWFSFFVGWLASTSILKYGGLRMYRRFRALFLGLLLGEFGAAAFWMIVDYFTGLRFHTIFP